MLAPAQSGRLLTRSLLLLSGPRQFLPSPPRPFLLRSSHLYPPSNALRSFSSFPCLSQHAYAEAPARQDEVKHTTPELTKFSELAEHDIIHPRIIDTITQKMNIHTMTDVQRLTINECLDGTDVIAQAKTGTGKTLAFLMPIVQRMMRDPTLLRHRPTIADTRALIISPTRELAEQIAVEAKKVTAGTGIMVQTAVGGTQKRFHLLNMNRYGCHVLVGTPGRVNDLLSDPSSGVRLGQLDTLVMDEADRLLDVGFAPAIDEIKSHLPSSSQRPRQTLMFSATVPRSVVDLVRQTLRPDFKFIRTVDPDEQPTHEKVPQNVVFMKGLQNVMPAIVEIAQNAIEAHKKDPENHAPFKCIVFFQSLNEVELAKTWLHNLRLPNASGTGRGMFAPHPLAPTRIIHMSSKLEQHQRTRNSEEFRRAESAILVSSDVTARGMDFPNVSHVIQVGMPFSSDQYIHRVGRTGRAGKRGQGYVLCMDSDRGEWQRTVGRDLRHVTEDDTLHTARLDMTRGGQLPASAAKVMAMVEGGIRAVDFRMKQDAYKSLLSVLRQCPTNYNKQEIVDIVNELSRFGWGMETPPAVPASWAAKAGFTRVRGLNTEADRPMMGGRDLPRRRESDDRMDPFGMGMGRGMGVARTGGYDSSSFGRRGMDRAPRQWESQRADPFGDR